MLLRRQLEQYSNKIVIAKDGNEALEQIESNKFDLILLDLQMPGYSGFELIKQCRTPSCINVHTPSIAITAHVRDSQRQDIIALGFDECLIKPVLDEQLSEIMRVWQQPKTPLSTNNQDSLDYIEIMLDRTGHNYALTQTIFIKLFNELPEQLTSIQTLMETKQLKNAMDLAHKLLGTVSFCGFNDIKEPCAQLETALMNRQDDDGWRYFNELQQRTLNLCNQREEIITKLNNTILSHQEIKVQ